VIWKLFVHAVSMVFRNIGPALRLSVVPFVIGVVVAGALFFMVILPMSGSSSLETAGPDTVNLPGLALGAVILLAVCTAVFLWVAVAWHRYVLLEEMPGGVLPPWHGREMMRYLGRGLMIAAALFIPLGILIYIAILPIIDGGSGSGMLYFLVVLAGLFANYAFYRLCPMLPAAALGRELGFGQSWAATAPAGAGLMLMIFFVWVLSILLNIPGAILGDNLVGTILRLAASWLMFMINLSIMTTIYGHFVEERDLVT